MNVGAPFFVVKNRALAQIRHKRSWLRYYHRGMRLMVYGFVLYLFYMVWHNL